MKISLQQLIGHGQFFQSTFLTAERFVSFCKARDINISIERLENFERLGIFLPLVRLRRPKIKIKIEFSKDGENYDELGILEDGEEWDGEIREGYSGFLWNEETVKWLIKDKYLWTPIVKKYESWKNYKDIDGDTAVESFYSIFQVISLKNIISVMNFPVNCETIAAWNQSNLKDWFRWAKKHSRYLIKLYQKGNSWHDELAKLGQILSNRYFPYAKIYEGMISLPHNDFFDWRKYRLAWDAKKTLKKLNLTVEEIQNLIEITQMQVSNYDPLEHWKDLTKFVRKSKKDELKGTALLAQTGYVLEKILNLFYKDLTGDFLYGYGENIESKESFYGQGVPQNDLAFLEFIVNYYGLNPRPKLFLFVEGYGEVRHFPRLAIELFGIKFPEIRIQIQNLHGVSGFEGDKKVDRYGAFEKLIEYYHDKQTIAFFILDKEGRVEQVKQKLVTKPSKVHPNRTITKTEYIKLWDKNVEFDNFTDEEIADAMTKLCEHRYTFTKVEIEDCRNRFKKEGDTLSRLYKAKTNYGSNKVKLLGILIDFAVLSPKFIVDGIEIERPLIKVLSDVCDLAMRNYQPLKLDSWKRTQDSELLGHSLIK